MATQENFPMPPPLPALPPRAPSSSASDTEFLIEQRDVAGTMMNSNTPHVQQRLRSEDEWTVYSSEKLMESSEKEVSVIHEEPSQEQTSVQESIVEDSIEEQTVVYKNPELKKLAVSEFFETERAYLENMMTLQSDFFARLQARVHLQGVSTIIDETDIYLLFNNLDAICELHTLMFNDMKNLNAEHRLDRNIGRVLRKYGKKFKNVYTPYVKDYEASLRLVNQQRKKNPAFQDFIRVSEFCTNKSFESLRAEPIQRLPRYVLMLENLLSHLSPDSEERKDLEYALSICREACGYAEATMKVAQASRRVHEISRTVSSKVKLTKRGRYCIKESDMLVSDDADPKNRFTNYFVFLFNDAIAYSTMGQGSKAPKLKEILPLVDCQVTAQTPQRDPENCHRGLVFKWGNNRKICLWAETSGQRDRWLQDARLVIDRCNKSARRGTFVSDDVDELALQLSQTGSFTNN
jgi:hypothetical protein